MHRCGCDNPGESRLDLKVDSLTFLRIFDIINQYGGHARLVGGVVRDALLGMSSQDIDIATNLLPDKVIEIFQKENFKVVPTGKSFGTVSVFAYLSDTDSFESFEITTLRKDLRCDGRRAYVEYCDDYFEDAKRRDFTINAISYDPITKKLYDYFHGIDDLKNGIVRFIGDPFQRISEDYLRILRYFRFLSRFTVIKKQDFSGISVDQASLSACKRCAEGIRTLSKERIKSEMDLILHTTNASYILDLMIDGGILQRLFNCENKEFKPSNILILREIAARFNKDNFAFQIDISAYYSLIFAEITLKELVGLKFSLKEAKLIAALVEMKQQFLVEYKQDAQRGIQYLQRFLSSKWLEDKHYQQFFLVACVYLYEYKNESIEDAFKLVSDIYKKLQTSLSLDGRRPQFPLQSSALIEMGFAGYKLGSALTRLKAIWIDSNFTITKEALLVEAINALYNSG